MESNKYRILYVGPLFYGGTCLQRMEAFKSLSHTIFPADTNFHAIQGKKKRLINRFIRKIYCPRDLFFIDKWGQVVFG